MWKSFLLCYLLYFVFNFCVQIQLISFLSDCADPNDLENYFTFRVHHGGEFDGKIVNYIGGSECFYDYVSLEELSMLDIQDIAIELGYNLPMVYWIQLPGYGKPFILDSDKDLMWF